jgi:hypothetical protein
MADDFKWKSEWSKSTPVDWDKMDGKARAQAAYDAGVSKANATSNKQQSDNNNLLGESGILLGQNLNKYIKIVGLLGDENAQQEAKTALMTIAQQALQRESTIRKGLVIDMGLMGGLQVQQNENIQQASIEAMRYGVELETVVKTLADLTHHMGRNVMVSDEDIARLAIFKEAMPTANVKNMVKYFDQMGYSVGEAIDKGNEMATVAKQMGLNVSAFMDTVTTNMNMMNTYNFADGVQGFAKMAAQAQKLGLSMSHVSRIADDVMDPEGAISLAANLQVIGGAVGDLADPFKLMNMATNDLEGLQNAIVQVGGELAVFNEETGEISFPPTAQRQLREMASVLNIGKDELASMIKLQTKFGAMKNQFSLDLEADPTVQDFVTNMARMNDSGKYEIELGGDSIELEDITADQVKELRKLREQQDQTDKMSEKDVLLQSKDFLQNISNNTKGIDTAILAGVAKSLNASEIVTELNDSIGKALSDGVLNDLSSNVGGLIATGVESIVGTDIKNLTTGVSDVANVVQAFIGTGTGAINDILTNLTEASEKDFQVQQGYFKIGEVKGKDVKDFELGPGNAKAVLTADSGFLIPSVNDTVSGVDLTAGAKGANLGSLVSGSGSVPEKTIKVEFTGIPSRIPIELNGKNMGDFNWKGLIGNNLFMQNLKSQLIETNLTTASGMNNERELARYDSMV